VFGVVIYKSIIYRKRLKELKQEQKLVSEGDIEKGSDVENPDEKKFGEEIDKDKKI
jgi:hypothetical protein